MKLSCTRATIQDFMHSPGYISGDFVKTLKLVLLTMEIHVNFFNSRARVSLNLSRVKCFETFSRCKA